MFSINIGNRLFQVGNDQSLASAINDMLSNDIQNVQVEFKEENSDVFVGGATRLKASQIEPLIKQPHTTKVVDQQNSLGVSDRSTIVYSSKS